MIRVQCIYQNVKTGVQCEMNVNVPHSIVKGSIERKHSHFLKLGKKTFGKVDLVSIQNVDTMEFYYV